MERSDALIMSLEKQLTEAIMQRDRYKAMVEEMESNPRLESIISRYAPGVMVRVAELLHGSEIKDKPNV